MLPAIGEIAKGREETTESRVITTPLFGPPLMIGNKLPARALTEWWLAPHWWCIFGKIFISPWLLLINTEVDPDKIVSVFSRLKKYLNIDENHRM